MYMVVATGLDDRRLHSVTARQHGPMVWDLLDGRSLQTQGTSTLSFAENEANPDFCPKIPPAGAFARATRKTVIMTPDKGV